MMFALAMARPAVSISDRLEGSHCFEVFEMQENTIIRTNDSLKMGAKFLDEIEVVTYNYCMKFCCQTSMCNTAVWDMEVRVSVSRACHKCDFLT